MSEIFHYVSPVCLFIYQHIYYIFNTKQTKDKQQPGLIEKTSIRPTKYTVIIMKKGYVNLKNTRKPSINDKEPFSTLRSKYFPSKISNLSVSFSSVTQMHWKPLTCWITALHPHVFRLFWFASSPRTSVQTH